MKEIQFKISGDGEVTVDAKGYKGPLCEKVTSLVVAALERGEPIDLSRFEKEAVTRVTAKA